MSLRGGFCLVAGCLLAVIRVELDVALQQRELGCVRPLEVVERSAWWDSRGESDLEEEVVLGPGEEPGEVRLWLEDGGQGGGQGAREELAEGGGKVASWGEVIVRELHVKMYTHLQRWVRLSLCCTVLYCTILPWALQTDARKKSLCLILDGWFCWFF